MSENTTPQIHTVKTMTLALLAGEEAKAVADQKRYEEAKAAGDLKWEKGERDAAAIDYRHALWTSETIVARQVLIAELKADLHTDKEREDAGTRWSAIPGTIHKGVGEGDAGLPGRDIEDVAIGELDPEERKHLQRGIEKTTDCELRLPTVNRWIWNLITPQGPDVALDPKLTCSEVYDLATKATDAQEWADDNARFAIDSGWLEEHSPSLAQAENPPAKSEPDAALSKLETTDLK